MLIATNVSEGNKRFKFGKKLQSIALNQFLPRLIVVRDKELCAEKLIWTGKKNPAEDENNVS